MKTRTAAPTLADIEAARDRIAGIARVTPVYPPRRCRGSPAGTIQLKAENLQRTGAFKIRGAVNTIHSLTPEERSAGVVAASAGNHGQAVAWAAREAGIAATVFMPQDSPMAKVDATRNYGAQVELAGAGFDESMAAAQEHVESIGATFVHAFEDERVIAGQGTIGLELAEQLPDMGTLVVPIGGGGLAAGIAIALQALRPGVRLVGVQAENMCPFAGGTEHRYTIAEGIAVKQPGTLTSAILARRARRRRHGHATTRSATRSCSCSSGRSCWSRAPARPRSPPCSPARRAGRTRSASSSPAATSTRRC